MNKRTIDRYCFDGNTPVKTWAKDDEAAGLGVEHYSNIADPPTPCDQLSRAPLDWRALNNYKMSRFEGLVYWQAQNLQRIVNQSVSFDGIDPDYPPWFFWKLSVLEPMICYITDLERIEETIGDIVTGYHWRPTVACFIDGTEVTDLLTQRVYDDIAETVRRSFANRGDPG